LGLIRLLLALAVLVGHSWAIRGLSFITPAFAVSIFFAISGFYMALVLNSKYDASGPGRRLFWSNRLLRLFPTYGIILLLTIAIYGGSIALGSPPLASTFRVNFPWLQIHTLASLAPGTLLLFAFVNLFIIGQDVTLFSSVRPNGSLALGPNLIGSPAGAYRFLLVPQAWSLSLELTFYAIAPFLLRRRLRVLFALLGASVALRIALILIGLDHDPWTYRFFPTALACFLLGAISFRLTYQPRTWHVPVRVGLVGVSSAAALIAFNGRLAWALGFAVPHSTGVVQAVAFGVVVVFMPAIFEVTKSNRIDAFLGDLSYPLYLVHLMVIQVLLIYAQVDGGIFRALVRLGTPYVGLLALAIAAGIVLLVERPIDRRRQRRVRTYREASAGETHRRAAETAG
jgi:peptidoglycan/LPS O-acetylase OafA/YrhL